MMKILPAFSAFILLALLLSIFSLPIFGYCQTYQCAVAAVKNFSFPDNNSPVAVANFYLDAVLYAGSASFSADRLLAFLFCLVLLAFALAPKARPRDHSAKLPGTSGSFVSTSGSIFAWLALHENSPTRS
ncbi:MAG: hypothetical protein KGL39_01910 [Patescibacteria group bacterium]|nr:hypothetical protein [Patescibacteria group bacterium]